MRSPSSAVPLCADRHRSLPAPLPPSPPSLPQMILAANYMDIKSLLDLCCAKVASMIKGKTTEEIRKTFNIKNDFTPGAGRRKRGWGRCGRTRRVRPPLPRPCRYRGGGAGPRGEPLVRRRLKRQRQTASKFSVIDWSVLRGPCLAEGLDLSAACLWRGHCRAALCTTVSGDRAGAGFGEVYLARGVGQRVCALLPLRDSMCYTTVRSD